MNPYKDIEDRSFSSSCHLTYEDIATKLLKDHHFLTALELHTELVESGKELPQLREFFSNPGNFEQHVSRASECSSMHRTPSQATLDSLDTARYSEDGGGDRGESGGDMAVLEFELRKARETINALRANLTQFADGEVLDKKTKDKFGHRLLKPHEKRTLNFLINEYLLLQNYKMTSITFSDENPDQDFEDWDDVGLNIPRPSNLMSLFWSNSTILNTPKNDVATQVNLHVTTDAECQVNLDDEMVCVSCQTHNENESDWNHELLIQAEEIVLLKQKLIALETEKLNFQKLYDAAIVSLNSLTSPTSESRMIDLQIPEDKLLTVQTTEQHLEMKTLTSTAAENHYGSSNSTHSGTPEQFEMIESDKNSIVRKEGSNTSSFEPGFLGEAEAQRRGSVTTLDETLSINDGGEWTRLHYDCAAADCGKDMWIHCGLPNSLKTSIMNWCGETLNLNEPLSNDLLAELVNSDKPMTLTGLLNLVVDTLPRILPHTLVARRSEAAALLAGGAALLPAGDARRARALHALLTLVKKPDAADARLICEAACLVVKWGGGGEVLSAIAELATCRSAERRALAGRACVAVAPYVPLELCSSLLLSLVLLMCDSNEPEMRCLGLKAAALVCPVAEHKYAQLEALMFNFLRDPVDRVVKDTVNMFVPVLARTALLSSGKLFLDLCGRVLENLVKACEDTEWKSVVLYLDVIRVLVFSVLVYVVNVQIVRDATLNTCDMQILNLQEVPLECEQIHFIDLQCYLADNVDVKTLLIAMNSLIKEKPDVRWSELTWFIDFIKQILEVAKNCRALNHPTIYELLITLFSNYVDNFGVQFTMYILKPLFMEIISDLEQKMEKLHSVNVDSAVVVGIYLAAVLPMLEDNVQHGEFLQKWVVYSSIRSLPVKIFSIPLMWLSKNRPDTLEYYLQQLRELLASSCDSGGGGAVRVLVGQLLAELVGSARLAGRCVEAQLLPAVAALLHDQQDEVRETGIALWGAVTRAVEADGEAGAGAAARCWELGERAAGAGAGAAGGRLARAAARALALLVLPAPRADRVSHNAVSLLCALCAAGPLSGECVSALAPGLQLAAHHAPAHPALLPALKKLEEAVQAPSMAQYRPSIEALVQSVSAASAGGGVCGGGSGAGGGGVAGGEGPREPPAPPRASNLLAAQEVGRRVTQMFQHSKTNIHLQNIFKKKT